MGVEMCFPLVLLFLSSGVPSHAQTMILFQMAALVDARRSLNKSQTHNNAAEPEPEPDASLAMTEHTFEVYRALTLNCSDSDDANAKETYTWTKNGTELSLVHDLAGRYELLQGGAVFKVKHAQEDDFGNYTCVGAGAGRRAAWRVRGKPLARLPDNTNVVEGQKLKLQCKVVGKPHPVVSWTFRNSSGPAEDAPLADGGEGARVRITDGEGGVEGATLVLEAAERADAGVYSCVPGADGVRAATTLRVKDMYAALWPFLGICAEVFVLCAIILVYEKRRTKPELDDSDTDNHDQKKS